MARDSFEKPSHGGSMAGRGGQQLVYGVVGPYLVFVERAQAKDLADLWRAILKATTWGEFRLSVSAERYEEVLMNLAHEAEGGNDDDSPPVPGDDDKFDGMTLPGVTDGDYPEWPAQEMLEWMPDAILDRPYCTVATSTLNGNFLIIDPSDEKDVVSDLSAAGFQCSKDQRLVELASGFE